MSFTSIEIVRKHILEKHLVISHIDSESAKLSALISHAVSFPPIRNGSETIKAILQTKPDFQMVEFDSGDQISLIKKPIVEDTAVVAKDSSLGIIYTENVDYLVDSPNGIITRLPDGAIASSQKLIIWYLPYKVYIKDIDYRISCSKGEISRLNDSAIQSGQTVLVDYDSEFGIVDDDVIVNAINEANERVLNYIDSAYTNSTDRSLVIGETYLAIAILCRIKAVEAANAGVSDSAKSSWLSIGEQYKLEALSILERFAGSAGSLTVPKKA
jgi:hypothetical protein